MINSNVKNIILAITCCIIVSPPVLAQVKTSIELQAIQTRTYEYNERGAMRAVLAVLQNNKFENIRSDANSGLITADLPAVFAGDTFEQQNEKAVAGIVIGMIIPFGGLFTPDQRTGTKTRTFSATIEEISSNKTNIRILLKETERITKTGFLGSTSEEVKENDMTTQPQAYQKIFEQIDKEIFVRLNR